MTHEFFTGLDDDDDAPEDNIGGAATEERKDNRNVVDDNTAQKMKHSDVEFLKESVADGKKIIDALTKNSKSFEDRTAFSKVKYLRKKTQKYAVWFEARRPTALNICETYHRSSPERLCNLRPDSLALLLNMANLSFQSRVILVDNTKGFL